MKPTAAPAHFPYLDHRTVAEADRDEALAREIEAELKAGYVDMDDYDRETRELRRRVA